MKNLKGKMKISLLTKGINKIFSRKKSNYKEVIDDLIDKQDISDEKIDDRTKNGADKFEGKHIHFGKGQFKDWKTVMNYLLNNN